ncbi:hypothetical protein QBC45DRAFT_397820 [Copromyces sp. CBS 386.78]|nr:hypothetical protein QBC45DRAFT_397820 [Copromyces sp. CBS 386.78]
MTREELICTVAKIYKDTEYRFAWAAEKVAVAREAAANYRNKQDQRKIRLENAQIEVNNLVLKYDSIRRIDMNSIRKLSYR